MDQSFTRSLPGTAQIEQALRSHVLGGAKAEAVIRSVLYPVTNHIPYISMSPGKGCARPTYSLEIPALGLKIERQAVGRVAARLHEVGTAVRRFPIGDCAPPDAPEFLVRTLRSQVRIRAANRATLQDALSAAAVSRLTTIYTPIDPGTLQEACETAIAWSRRTADIPAGPLRLIEEIRSFLDRARLEATLAFREGLNGASASISLSLTERDEPRLEVLDAKSTHSHLANLDRLQGLGRKLTSDRDGWLACALPAGPGAIPVASVRLTIEVKDRNAVPEVCLSITDVNGLRVAPADHDSKAGLRLDSSTLMPRTLLYSLRPDGLQHWIVDLAGQPISPPKPLLGTHLAEALAIDLSEGPTLDHAALCRLLGSIAVRRSSAPDTPLAFVAPISQR